MNHSLQMGVQEFLQSIDCPYNGNIQSPLSFNYGEQGRVELEDLGDRLMVALVQDLGPSREDTLTILLKNLYHGLVHGTLDFQLQVGCLGDSQIIIATQLSHDLARGHVIADAIDEILSFVEEAL